jgi:SAM-dependent methyltransferase
VSLTPEYFDDLYRAAPDPWGFTTRWYEERKYALTLAALPRRRYSSAFEPGCSIGVLTAGLAERCDALLAADVATAALAATRRRVGDLPHVRVEQCRLPQDWPDETFDLVVLSEVGYYLDADALARLVEVTVGGMSPGADLVLVHWRHPVADYPLSGDAVHDAFGASIALERTVRHAEADFLLEVFSRVPPAGLSVAAREGLC